MDFQVSVVASHRILYPHKDAWISVVSRTRAATLTVRSTGTNSPVRCASRISPGPITTDSLPSAIICAASVPNATVPDSRPGSLFQQPDQRRIGRSLETCILAVRVDLALKIRIGLRLFLDRGLERD